MDKQVFVLFPFMMSFMQPALVYNFMKYYSLIVPTGYESDVKSMISKLIIQNKRLDTVCEIALRWIP